MRLWISDTLHMAPDSLLVTNRALKPAEAWLALDAREENAGPASKDCTVATLIADPAGHVVAATAVSYRVAAGGSSPVHFSLKAKQPRAWSPAAPNPYRATVRVVTAGRVVGSGTTKFGIRTLHVSTKESESPPGERLHEYAVREWARQPHVGETPPQIIREIDEFSANAVREVDAAEPLVTKNRDEFERLRNDVHCIRRMSVNYGTKARSPCAFCATSTATTPAT